MTARRPGVSDSGGWQRISPERFAAFGVQAVAYVRPVPGEDGGFFAVCAADGTEMARFTERATAFAAVRQHDMEPLSLH